jgi:(E)-4-hydroxy-3-methylbut-2-enyl-diphosphate synthase
MVGKVGIGGDNPIRVQSMITCDTMDTEASIQQTLDLVAAGCEIVRITAPTVKDARNLEFVKAGLLARGCDVPIVADIHFKPDAALEAARWVDKVRVNPGNFADSKKFAVKEYTDEQYAAELERIRERFTPLVQLCQQRGISIRVGTNHGSLSDRIMNRYGDTPLGMVESALEFARIARDHDFHDLIFSMKASNPKVMIAAYRLLVDRLEREGADWNYPVHLGVTEAGDGEDGRIKSAIGIGSLLNDGIGDTVRVSLTEDSVHEIPVARALVELAEARRGGGVAAVVNKLAALLDPRPEDESVPELRFDPFTYRRRESAHKIVGGVALGVGEVPRVVVRQATFNQVAHKLKQMGDFQPEIVYEQADVYEIDPRDTAAIADLNGGMESRFVTVRDDIGLPVVGAFRLLAARLAPRHPILLKDTLNPSTDPQKDFLRTLLVAATHIGSLLCDGIGDAVLIQGEEAPGQSLRLAYNILQGAG